MKRLKKTSIVLLVIALIYFGFNLSKGPTLIIKTSEPAEDFVVLCQWNKEGLLRGGHGGGTYRSDYKVIVAESEKEISCGWSIWGGRGGSKILHPLYTNMQGTLREDGVNVIKPVTKISILGVQKAKFEAGYWDKNKFPGPKSVYLSSLPGCGFPHQYFDYYKEVKKVNVEYFKKYQEALLECLEKSYIEIKKYDPYSAKQIRAPKTRMSALWESIKKDASK